MRPFLVQPAKISVNDKARVPLEIAAVTAQTPLLMHMEYRVRLPDHDWVVTDWHKLITMVYAGVAITTEAIWMPQAKRLTKNWKSKTSKMLESVLRRLKVKLSEKKKH